MHYLSVVVAAERNNSAHGLLHANIGELKPVPHLPPGPPPEGACCHSTGSPGRAMPRLPHERKRVLFSDLVRSFDLAIHLRASCPCQTTPRPASCLYSLYKLRKHDACRQDALPGILPLAGYLPLLLENRAKLRIRPQRNQLMTCTIRQSSTRRCLGREGVEAKCDQNPAVANQESCWGLCLLGSKPSMRVL